MSITGLSSSLGMQYNFASMSNSELLNAAHTLANEGKISGEVEAGLVSTASGCDSITLSGTRPSTTEILQDPTKRNFIDEYQKQMASAESTGSSKGVAWDSQILTALSKYQDSNTNSSISVES